MIVSLKRPSIQWVQQPLAVGSPKILTNPYVILCCASVLHLVEVRQQIRLRRSGDTGILIVHRASNATGPIS